MKELNGAELAGYIKERQAREVRSKWGNKGAPALRIIRDNDNPVIAKYVGLKKRYGEDIGVLVEDIITQDIAKAVEEANGAEYVDGIIVQLPLVDMDGVEKILAGIAPEKDVDGLSGRGGFDSATATAINWLLTGYGVEVVGKKIAIVGRGRLVGAPLAKMWRASGVEVEVFEKDDGKDLCSILPTFDVIVTATGVPRLITSDMIRNGAAVVDAGTASEGGVLVGDVAEEVRERSDVSITPRIGGVGPLTVAVLFDNVIRAAKK
jgi:methylenetetrahydrofolate dehydrogenase (NADP+)/methenyltetrahydrofolate cyclohydrolase